MCLTKLSVYPALSVVIGISFCVAADAQGISEMGAAHAMGATLGAGLHRNVGATTGGLNSTYGSLNKQMNNLTGGSSGSSGGSSAGGFSGSGSGVDALGDPIDPRVTVKNAGKESNHYYDLAVQKQRAGKNLEAEKLYRQSLAIRQSIWGGKDPAVPRLILTIADLTRKRGDLPGAESCYRDLLKMQLKTYGAGSIELVPVLEKLGVVCFDQKKYADAENYLQQVYLQRSRRSGFDNAETVKIALELAQTRIESNDWSGATEVLKKSIDAKSTDTGTPQMVKLVETYISVLKKQNKQPEELAAMEAKLLTFKPGPVAKSEDSANPGTPTVTEETKSTTIDTSKSDGTTATSSSTKTTTSVKSESTKSDTKLDAGH